MRLLLTLLFLVVSPAAFAEPAAMVADLLAKGDAAVAAYDPAHGAATADAVSDLYFDGFEASGLEAAAGMADPALKDGLEAGFGRLVGLVRHGAPKAAVTAEWQGLRAALAGLPGRLGHGGSGALAVFMQSFLILVREGFEAMLVVTALAATLRRSGAADKVGVVTQGVGWAVAASLATAWALSSLVDLSGKGREAMEGGTMLLAAVVLFYCSYWLFAKREAVRWQRYVQGRVERALSGDRLFALGFAAFLAVYREGAETVLFYQALAADSAGHHVALAAGLGAAVAALALIYLAMTQLSVRLPLGLFFAGTAALLYYLALAFAGKGVVELQNGNVLPATPLAGWPSIGWLGVNPTAEGMAAQAALVIPLLAALAWQTLPRRADTP